MNKGSNAAFPESCTQDGFRANVEPGMDIRTYAAIKMMQAIIASPAKIKGSGDVLTCEIAAESAIGYADALLDMLARPVAETSNKNGVDNASHT